MQSKFLKQGVWSSKTMFFMAPGLIGVTAIVALISAMSMGDRPLKTRISGAQETLPIPAQPLNAEAKPTVPTTKQPAIAAEPLQSPNSSVVTSSGQRQNSATKATPLIQAKTLPPTQQSTGAATQRSAPVVKQSSPKQTALTMGQFSPAQATDVPQIPIRVAIVHDAQSFTVATSDAGFVTDAQGQVLAKLSPQNAIGVSRGADGLQVGAIRSASPVWIRPQSEQGVVFVNGNWYRGMVQLIPDQEGILAVNHVEMQSYLYSVVGAEMYHDWPAEALKAQAIAARSYALVHIVRPASRYYDLGSTQRWQAYKGLNSEAASPRNAVDATRGIVISHQGGVVESLYASSAELVQDAHRGFGMSQYGARDLAQQNLDYRQILSRFYPGTELSLLQAKS